MSQKSINTLYWVFTIVLSLLLVMDGISGVARAQAGQDVLRHLGYPMYLMTISGVAKLLAVVALVQPRWPILKEWAFAGLAINFIGAFASRAYVGDTGLELIFPLIVLAFMFVPYFLWKKQGATLPA